MDSEGFSMEMQKKYKVGDIISWYCDMEQCIHKAKVLFVNYAGAGYPDINYEVKCICCGEEKTVFVDEMDTEGLPF